MLSSCLGHRISGQKKFLIPYGGQWTQFCDKQLKSFDDGFVWRVEFDVQTFFENIHIETLLDILKDKFGIQDTKVLGILDSQLKAWSENATLCGIPQGANASHVLANGYLYPLDTFIDDLKGGHEFQYFRYVDDIVVMAKNAETLHHITYQVVSFLRTYNLKLNEKTKLVKLKNTTSIEELKFYNPYGQISEITSQKIEKIGKKIPGILKKVRNGSEIKKSELSNLRYYLKAGVSVIQPTIIDSLIESISKKPSLTDSVCKYLGFFLSDNNEEFYTENKRLIHSKYKKVWESYTKNNLTGWTKFWLLKILIAPDYSREHEGLQTELHRIVADPSARFLAPLAFFYEAYTRESLLWDKAINNEPLEVEPGFTSDDLRRQIRNVNTEAEQATYYYFTVYLKTDAEIKKELIFEALESESLEIQMMGVFLFTKLQHLFEWEPAGIENQLVTKQHIFLNREITGAFSRIFFDLPQKTILKPKSDSFLTDEGKINEGHFASFLGIQTPLQVELVGKAQQDLEKIAEKSNLHATHKGKPGLRSIHLVSNSLNPASVIFLVLDGHYEMPYRCSVRNNAGKDTYTKKLFDIAYFGDAPGKMVAYNERLSDDINNALFRRRPIKQYLTTNKIPKSPTIVKKSEDGKSLVLTHEVDVNAQLVKQIPTQHQNKYTDKTR